MYCAKICCRSSSANRVRKLFDGEEKKYKGSKAGKLIKDKDKYLLQNHTKIGI